MDYSRFSDDRRVRLANTVFFVGHGLTMLWLFTLPFADVNSTRTTWPLLLIAGSATMSVGQHLKNTYLNKVVFRLDMWLILLVVLFLLVSPSVGAASHNGVMGVTVACLAVMYWLDSYKVWAPQPVWSRTRR